MILFFRVLVVLCVVCLMATMLLDAYWVSDLPRIRLAMKWMGEGSIFSDQFVEVYYYLYFPLNLAVYVCLFFFFSFARYLLIGLVAASLLVSSLDGLIVTVGLLSLTTSALSLIDGALISMSFFSSLSKEFSRGGVLSTRP